MAEIWLILGLLREAAHVLMFMSREKNSFPPQEDVSAWTRFEQRLSTHTYSVAVHV